MLTNNLLNTLFRPALSRVFIFNDEEKTEEGFESKT
jgi:hypothetical protein